MMMMTTTKFLPSFLLLATSSVLTTLAAKECSVSLANGGVQQLLPSQNELVEVVISTDPSAETISVDMTWEGLGYVAFAFSDDDKMPGSVAVIGNQENGVQKYNLNGYGPNDVVVSEQQTLSNTEFNRNDTHTTMSFTKLLTEDGEPPISLTSTNNFLWATGSNGDAVQYHGFGAPRGATTHNFDEHEASCAGPPPPPTEAPVVAPTSPPDAAAIEQLPNGGTRQTLSTVEDVLVTLTTTPPDGETPGSLTVDMSYEGQGYVAFAFSEDLLMPGSVAIIGTNGAVEKYDLGGYAQSQVVRAPDSRQTLSDIAYNQNATHTTMSFTKLLEETDEPTISLTGTNNFLWAYGSSNDIQQHATTARGPVAVNLADGSVTVETSTEKQSLWVLHGICMGVSWVILVPFGIAASVARAYLPAGPAWFQAHRMLNGLAVLLTVIGFIIAFAQIQSSGKTHFNISRHHKVGLVVFLFAVAQAANGFFRPHAPHKIEKPKKEMDEEVNEDNAGKQMEAEEDEYEEKEPIRAIWEVGHRLLGLTSMILGWFNTSSGIELYSGRYDTIDFGTGMWVYVAIIAVATLAMGVMSAKKQGS